MNPTFPEGESLCERVLQFLSEYANSKNMGYYFPNRWRVHPHMNDPKFKYSRQRDGVSCGVYVIASIDTLSIHLDEFYDNSEECFDLSSHVNDDLIKSNKVRLTILALIIMFKKSDFTHEI